MARKVLFVLSVMVLAATLGVSPAYADSITLGGSIQTCMLGNLSGCITITKVASNQFSVFFPSTLSGATIPSGGYSFNSVGTLFFTGGAAATGSPYSSGTAGTLTVGGQTVPLTWTLLDGDGSGFTLSFRTPLGPALGEIFLSPPVSGPPNFTTLFSTSPINTQANASISAGQVIVPEPGTLALFGTGLLGLAGLALRKITA